MDNCKNERIIQTANIHGNNCEEKPDRFERFRTGVDEKIEAVKRIAKKYNCKRRKFIFLERKTIINPRKNYNKTKLFPKSIEWGRAERLFPTDSPSGKAYAVKEKGTEGKILLKIIAK